MNSGEVKMKLSVFCMLGIAFTLGLGVGLLVHLPAAHAPVSAGEGATHLGRQVRQLAEASEWLPGLPNHPQYNEISPVFYYSDFNYSKENTTYVKHAEKSDKSRQSEGKEIYGVNGEIDNVKALKAKIKHIHDSIHVLKGGTEIDHDKVLNSKDNIQTEYKMISQQEVSEGLKEERPLKLASRRVWGTRKVSVKVHKSPDNRDNSGVSVQTGGENVADGKNADRHLQKTPGDFLQLSVKGANTKEQSQLSKQFRTLSDLVTGVFWSDKLEAFVSAGFSKEDVKAWREKVQNEKVRDMKEGCGRMQNRQLVLGSSGTKACARYRINTDQMQGEIYSFYLGRLLGIQNVPPSVLAIPDIKNPQWNAVAESIHNAKWTSDKVVLLTPWIDSLEPAYIPREFRNASGRLNNSLDLTRNRTLGDIFDLVQWSDLIIFDYLTANVDRVVNNMYNLQWNPDMMSSPTHNLEKSAKKQMLIFLDNESGLFHSYRLLDKYASYHETLLKSLCLFRKSTVDMIEKLHRDKSVGTELETLFEKEEPLHRELPKMSDKNIHILESRIESVFNHVQYCKKMLKS